MYRKLCTYKSFVPQMFKWKGDILNNGTVAHKCHGKTFFLTAKLSFSRQNTLSQGKTLFLTAKHSFSRQNFLSHGKTFFLTATFSFYNQISQLHKWKGKAVASKPGGPGGTGPPLFCNAVSNENNMKNIEITNGLILKNMLHSLLPGCQ